MVSGKKVCPKFVHDFKGFDDQMKKVTENTVELAKKLDFDLDEDDVEELLDSHSEELFSEDLTKLEAIPLHQNNS
jgi:hypothetical protein